MERYAQTNLSMVVISAQQNKQEKVMGLKYSPVFWVPKIRVTVED